MLSNDEFSFSIVYIALGFYVLAATAGLYNLLAPFIGLIPLSDRCRFVSYSLHNSGMYCDRGVTAGFQPTSCQF